MTIGAGWAEGAWVDAGWVVGAWAQPTATKTIGGTSQLEAFSSTGTLTVQNQETIGGTSQIEAFSSTGGLNLGWQIGGTSQLAAFTSSGFIQVGDVVADETNAGGWGSFWVDYELEQYRKDEARKKQKRLEAKAQKIKDELERQIALEQRRLEREELRRAELVKITNLAARAADAIEDMRDNTLKVALTAAVEQQTFSTMERLERELRLLKEEEEFLLMAAEIILNDRRIH